MTDWRLRLAVLADQLSAEGKLQSPRWRDAFCAVPRHELVPEIYEQDQDRRWCVTDSGTDHWWDLVYSDTTVITSVRQNSHGHLVPLSSSTKPGLMLRMLEALEVANGMRVLEIGTGTGYNAALLSERLGAEHVFSVDLRPELIELARERLARLGYQPTLAARDGTAGLPEHGAYDRIIGTCGVPSIPAEWITQLAPDGALLVDLEGPLSAGNLVLLRRASTAAELSGQFLPWFGRFMPMRHDVTAADYHLPEPTPDKSAPVDAGWTTVNPLALDNEFRLLAQLHLPGGTFHTLTAPPEADYPTHTRLVSPDGSWCEVAREPGTDGKHELRQAGPSRLWNTIETAYHEWCDIGEPEWSRFGVTVTPTSTRMWLDDPDSRHQWPLWTRTTP